MRIKDNRIETDSEQVNGVGKKEQHKEAKERVKRKDTFSPQKTEDVR